MRVLSCALFGLVAPGLSTNFCTDIDAVLTEPLNGKYVNHSYFFKDDMYYKYDVVSNSPVSGYPKAISKGWRGFPNGVDAILTEPDVGAHAGFAWTFKGSKVWKYNTMKDKVASGNPLNFTDAFPGLPSAFYQGVNAAFAGGPNHGKYHGNAYFFKGGKYAVFDLRAWKGNGDSLDIADGFPNMPSQIDTILAQPPNGKYKSYLYFFMGDKYWKWDAVKETAMKGYPASIEHGWNLCAPAPPPVSKVPEQVHLALGKTVDSMSVAWVTSDTSAAEVQWGKSKGALDEKATGDSRTFDQDSGRTWYTHVAMMTGLSANTRYYYRVGAGADFSQVFSFMHRRSGTPSKHILMGDMGSSNAYSLCTACDASSEICDATVCGKNTSVGLVSEVDVADMIIHLGDFAYDLDGKNGITGDNFMRNIEQLAAYVPYMVAHGNHEDRGKALAHFVERFRSQPSNAVPNTFKTTNGETTNTLYFSWDAGLVHYVSISTEFFFGITDGKSTSQTMIDWLKGDLEVANKNRESVPWIVVQGHRGVYCTCSVGNDCGSVAAKVRAALEDILMDYGVDFYINGHEHNYERTYPVYGGKSDRSNVDPKAPIYIVTGAAGSHEMHEPFTREQPSWSAFRSNSFGYSILWAHNATHVHWQQVQTDPTSFPLSNYGRVIDDFWTVQHNHGAFNRDYAPLGEAFPTGQQHPRSRQLDHWWPLLGLEDNGVDATDAIIRDFRVNNEELWKRKLDGLMGWVGQHLGAESTWKNVTVVQWEDVRDDGSSDCATCGPPELLV